MRRPPPELIYTSLDKTSLERPHVGKATACEPGDGTSYLASAQSPAHRVETFKLSRDPEFVRKLRDIVGPYLNPPAKALAPSVDRRTRFKRWIARSRSCRCGPGPRRGRRLTTRGTARPRSLRR